MRGESLAWRKGDDSGMDQVIVGVLPAQLSKTFPVDSGW